MRKFIFADLKSPSIDEPNPERHTWPLLSLLTVCLLISCLLRNDGGMNADSICYFNMANNLGHLSSNVFPVGYPIVLRLVYFFTHDYFWASKVVNVVALSSILILSYRTNFFFFETSVLLCFKVGIGLFFFSYSEPLFIALLYYYIYFIYRYFEHGEDGIAFMVAVPLLLTGLLLVRYTGIYIYLASGAFYIFLFLKEPFKQHLRFFLMMLGAAGIMSLYLIFNLYSFGSWFGENFRGFADYTSPSSFFVTNLFGIIGVINPIFTLNLTDKKGINLWMKIIPIAVDLIFVVGSIYFLVSSKLKLTNFHKFLLCLGTIFLCFLFYSSFKTSLETIGVRLVAPAAVVLIFSFLILFCSIYGQFRYALVLAAYFSLALNLLYNIKNGGNYLQRRERILLAISKKAGAHYFIRDREDILTTSINIPVVDIKFTYRHANQSSGDLNQWVLFALLPNLKELDSSKGYRNEEIIFNSEIR